MATGAKLTLNVSTVEVKSLRGIVETICTQGEPSGQALKSHLESFPLSDKEEDGTALMVAAKHGRSDLLDILIGAGMPPNLVGRPTLDSNRGVMAAVDRWMNGEASALYIAAQAGHAECVSLLILANANANFEHTQDGSSPLYASCEAGHPECAARLLTAGANADHPRKTDGRTPLGAACANGHYECARLLCSHGAVVDKAPQMAEATFTPFDLAVQYSRSHASASRVMEACLAMLGPVPMDASGRIAALEAQVDALKIQLEEANGRLLAAVDAGGAATDDVPLTPRSRAAREAVRRQESAQRREDSRTGSPPSAAVGSEAGATTPPAAKPALTLNVNVGSAATGLSTERGTSSYRAPMPTSGISVGNAVTVNKKLYVVTHISDKGLIDLRAADGEVLSSVDPVKVDHGVAAGSKVLLQGVEMTVQYVTSQGLLDLKGPDADVHYGVDPASVSRVKPRWASEVMAEQSGPGFGSLPVERQAAIREAQKEKKEAKAAKRKDEKKSPSKRGGKGATAVPKRGKDVPAADTDTDRTAASTDDDASPMKEVTKASKGDLAKKKKVLSPALRVDEARAFTDGESGGAADAADSFLVDPSSARATGQQTPGQASHRSTAGGTSSRKSGESSRAKGSSPPQSSSRGKTKGGKTKDGAKKSKSKVPAASRHRFSSVVDGSESARDGGESARAVAGDGDVRSAGASLALPSTAGPTSPPVVLLPKPLLEADNDKTAAAATPTGATAAAKPAFGMKLNIGKIEAKAAAGGPASDRDVMKDAEGNEYVVTDSYRLVPAAEANKAATAVQQSARAWMAAKGKKSFVELRPEKQAAVRQLGLAQRQEKKEAKRQARTPEEAASYLQLSARGFLQAKRVDRAEAAYRAEAAAVAAQMKQAKS